MKIEILEKIMHGRDVFEAGETRMVPDDVGKLFCDCGWARDVDGNVATAERDPHRVVTLDVNNTNHLTMGDSVDG